MDGYVTGSFDCPRFDDAQGQWGWRGHVFTHKVLGDRGSVSDNRLNQVDEVAADVLKQDGGGGPHVLWFTAEADTTLLETPVLRGDVIRYEKEWMEYRRQTVLLDTS